MGIKITIKGKVHGVGYRLFLLEEADRLLISHFYAQNVKIDDKEGLVVLIDGEKEQIEKFVEFVKKSKPADAIVEQIKIEEYKEAIMEIERFRAAFNSAQLSKIVQSGIKLLQKTDEIIGSIKEESEKTRQVVVEESEKTRQTIKEEAKKGRRTIRDESEKTRKEFGGKIDILRMDLREFMEYRLREIRIEINEIKEALKKAGIL